MFMMSCSILEMDETIFIGKDGLISHAAQCGFAYLHENDGENLIANADGKAVVTAIDSIRSLFNNKTAMQRMESAVGIDDACPSILGKSSDAIKRSSKAIYSWATRAKQLKDLDIDESSRQFINEVADTPTAILLYIARKHADNWLASEYPGEAFNCFRLAEQALYDAGYTKILTSVPKSGKSSIYNKFTD